MITDIFNYLRSYKGSYEEKVRALMRVTRNTINNEGPGFELDIQEHPVHRYDYDTYCTKKRIEGTVSGITEARKRLSGILSAAHTDAMFAFSNSLIMKGGYNYDVDRFNWIALSSAIWILDELLLSGKINEIYQYLPILDKEKHEETLCVPVKHPIYDDDLIFALVYLIRHRNTANNIGDSELGSLVWEHQKRDSDEKSLEYRTAFDSIIALLNQDVIKEAVNNYEEKVWEFYRIAFAIMAVVERNESELIEELDDLQKQTTGSATELNKPKNVLLMQKANSTRTDDLFISGKDFERHQAKIQQLQSRIDRLEDVSMIWISLPNDREKLVKSLKGIITNKLSEELISFHVEDPFEAAFALLYLFDTDSIIPWLYYGSISVAYTLCDQLPYDTMLPIPEKPIKLTEWNEALYKHRYKGYRFENITDASGEPVMREYAKNLSQLVFSNTLSLIPRVVPEQTDLAEYFNSFGELTDHEKEAYSLLSYVLVSGQLRTDTVSELQTVQEMKRLIEDELDDLEDEIDFEFEVEDTKMKAENDRLRAKNQELIEMVSSMLVSRKNDSKQVQLLKHQIELQEKELSDLRETVYLFENDNYRETQVDETIPYPYAISKKIISFGGHDAWLKEMRRKLPNVMFIAPDSLPNIDLVRHADVVWLQTNCLSHSDFYRIINIVRQNGIPLRYFTNPGPEKCAEQLVKSLN